MVLKEVGVYGFPNFVVFLTQINTIDCWSIFLENQYFSPEDGP